MRHRVRSRRLGRQTDHRLSMLKNLTKSLLTHKKITTTEMRARELTRYVDNVITWAKKAHVATDVHEKLAHKRQVFRHIPGAPRNGPSRPDRDINQELFEQIAVRFSPGGESARAGGYTRTTKLYPRKGDGATVVLVELL